MKFWKKKSEDGRPLRIKILDAMTVAGTNGITVKEVRQTIEPHHGHSSGCLSLMHEEGLINRLAETRDGCKIYVLIKFVDGRETELTAKQRKAAKDNE